MKLFFLANFIANVVDHTGMIAIAFSKSHSTLCELRASDFGELSRTAEEKEKSAPHESFGKSSAPISSIRRLI